MLTLETILSLISKTKMNEFWLKIKRIAVLIWVGEISVHWQFSIQINNDQISFIYCNNFGKLFFFFLGYIRIIYGALVKFVDLV